MQGGYPGFHPLSLTLNLIKGEGVDEFLVVFFFFFFIVQKIIVVIIVWIEIRIVVTFTYSFFFDKGN